MLLWLASCGLIGVPSAGVDGVALTRLGMTEAALDVTVGVDNPMWVDLHLEGLRWSLSVASHKIGSGASRLPAVLAARSESPVVVPVSVRYVDLWNAAGATFSGNEIPYRMSLEIDTVTPTGLITVPLVHEGTLPALRPPTIDIVHLDWEVEADGRLRVDLGVDLALPESFAVNRVDWTIDVDGRVLGSGVVAVQSDGVLNIPARLDPAGAAQASWDWLWGTARQLQLAVDGTVGTPLGLVPISTRATFVLSESAEASP